MLQNRIKTTATLTLLYCSFAIAAEANAAMLQLDFFVTFDHVSGTEFSTGQFGDLPAHVTMSGSVTWDTSLPPLSSDGVSNRDWEYTSFEAVVAGSFLDFDSNATGVSFTPSTPAVPGNGNGLATSLNAGSGDTSMSWINSNWTMPAAFSGGSFGIFSPGISAMPHITSPLPSDPGDYYGDSPIQLICTFSTHDNDIYSFVDPSISSFVVREVVPAPGAATLLGLSGIIAMRRKR